MDLKNKVAIVTGASDGIGREIALKLAKEGVSLALVARNEEKLKEVKKESEESGSPKVEIYPCDLRNKDDIKISAEKIISDFGNVNVLINNAGIWQKVDQLDTATLEDIENVITTNLVGVVMMTRMILPNLRNQSDAAIINVSSHSGIEAKAGQSVYCSSKWGVTGFTETLRVDLKGSGIRVAGVYQGGTKTKLFEKANDPKSEFDKFSEPSDLADVVVFMLSRPPKIWLHDVRIEY